MMADNIKVVIKIRPLIKREINDNLQPQWHASENSIFSKDEQGREVNSYTFDNVFDEACLTKDVYDKAARCIVEAAVDGINGTIFAYGQTSSGKTYTMMGDSSSPGIIPLAVENIFNSIESKLDRDFLLRVSYLEIYNEKIRDLLDTSNTDLKIHEHFNGVMTTKCKEEVTNTPEQILEAMKRGNRNRSTGETQMNERSSRSHTIFQIIIESRKHVSAGLEEEVCVNVSQLNLVDLAGSERATQTLATKTRLHEACHINKSLTTLSLVIRQLSEAQGDVNRFINFRDSKLTRMLQHSLGGNAKTGIICAVTPAAFEETLSTLQFAVRAKVIENKPKINAVMTDATQLKVLTKEMACLQEELESKKHLEVDNQRLQQQIAILRDKILMGNEVSNGAQRAQTQRRRTWCAPRRCTLPTLDPIAEAPSLSTDFNTWSRNIFNINNDQRLSNLAERDESFLSSRESKSLSGETPPNQQSTNANSDSMDSDVICLDDSRCTDVCSPPHKCFSDFPVCVLKKRVDIAEKELKELQEMTTLEKQFKPTEVEYLKDITKLRQQNEHLILLKNESDSKLAECQEQIKALKASVKSLYQEKNGAEKSKVQADAEAHRIKCTNTDLEVELESLRVRTTKREEELVNMLMEARKESHHNATHNNNQEFINNFLNMSHDISLSRSDGEPSLVDIAPPVDSNRQSLIAQKDGEITDILTELTALKEQCHEKAKEINALKINISERDHSINILKGQFHDLDKQLLEKSDLYFELNKNFNIIQIEKANQSSEIIKLQTLTADLEAKVDHLTEEQSRSEILKYSPEKNIYETELKNKENEIKFMQSEIEAIKNENLQDKKKNNTLEEEKENLLIDMQSEIHLKSKELSDLQKSLADLTEELKYSNSNQLLTVRELENAGKEVDLLKVMNEKYNNIELELQTVTSECACKNLAIQKLNDEIKVQSERIADLLSELESKSNLKDLNNNLIKENEELKDVNNSLRKDVNDSLELLSQQKLESYNFMEKLQSLECCVQDKCDEIVALSLKLVTLEEQQEGNVKENLDQKLIIANLEDELSNKADDLINSTKEIIALKSEINLLEASMQKHEILIQNRGKAMGEASERESLLKISLNSCKGLYDCLAEENICLNETISKLNVQILEMNNTIEEKNQANVNYQSMIENLHHDITQGKLIEKEYQELKSTLRDSRNNKENLHNISLGKNSEQSLNKSVNLKLRTESILNISNAKISPVKTKQDNITSLLGRILNEISSQPEPNITCHFDSSHPEVKLIIQRIFELKNNVKSQDNIIKSLRDKVLELDNINNGLKTLLFSVKRQIEVVYNNLALKNVSRELETTMTQDDIDVFKNMMNVIVAIYSEMESPLLNREHDLPQQPSVNIDKSDATQDEECQFNYLLHSSTHAHVQTDEEAYREHDLPQQPSVNIDKSNATQDECQFNHLLHGSTHAHVQTDEEAYREKNNVQGDGDIESLIDKVASVLFDTLSRIGLTINSGDEEGFSDYESSQMETVKLKLIQILTIHQEISDKLVETMILKRNEITNALNENKELKQQVDDTWGVVSELMVDCEELQRRTAAFRLEQQVGGAELSLLSSRLASVQHHHAQLHSSCACSTRDMRRQLLALQAQLLALRDQPHNIPTDQSFNDITNPDKTTDSFNTTQLTYFEDSRVDGLMLNNDVSLMLSSVKSAVEASSQTDESHCGSSADEDFKVKCEQMLEDLEAKRAECQLLATKLEKYEFLKKENIQLQQEYDTLSSELMESLQDCENLRNKYENVKNMDVSVQTVDSIKSSQEMEVLETNLIQTEIEHCIQFIREKINLHCPNNAHVQSESDLLNMLKICICTIENNLNEAKCAIERKEQEVTRCLDCQIALTRTITQLQETLSTKQSALEINEASLESITAELKFALAAVEEKTTNNAHLCTQLEDVRNSEMNLTRSVQEFTEMKTELLSKVEQLEAERNNWEIQIKDLKSVREFLETRLVQKQLELDEKINAQKNFESKASQLSSQIKDHLCNINVLQDDVKHKKNELENKNKIIETLQAEVKTKEDNLCKLKNMYEEKQSWQQSSEFKENELHTNIRYHLDTIAHLEGLLHGKNSELDDKCQLIECIQSELRNNENKLSELILSLSQANAEKADVEHNLKQKQQEYNELQKLASHLKSAENSQKQAAEEMEAVILEMQQEVQTQSKLLHDHIQENVELKKNVEDKNEMLKVLDLKVNEYSLLESRSTVKIIELTNNCSELSTAVNRMREEKNISAAHLQQLSLQVQNQQRQIENMTAEYNTMSANFINIMEEKEKLTAFVETLQEYESKYRKLDEQSAILQKECQELTSTNLVQEVKIKDLETQIEDLLKNNTKEQDGSHDRYQKIHKMPMRSAFPSSVEIPGEVPPMSHFVDKMTHERVKNLNEELTATNKDLCAKNKKLLTQIRRLEHSLRNSTIQSLLPNDRTHIEDQALQNQVKQLQDEVCELKKEVVELNQKYKEVDEECEMCVNELKVKNEAYNNMFAENSLLQAQITNLESELRSLKSSSPMNDVRRKRLSMHDVNRSLDVPEKLPYNDEKCTALLKSNNKLSEQVKHLLCENSQLKHSVSQRICEACTESAQVLEKYHDLTCRYNELQATLSRNNSMLMYQASQGQASFGLGVVQNQKLCEMITENDRLKTKITKLTNLCRQRGTTIGKLEEEVSQLKSTSQTNMRL